MIHQMMIIMKVKNNGLEYPNKYVVYVFPGIKNNTKVNKNYKVSPKKLEEYL